MTSKKLHSRDLTAGIWETAPARPVTGGAAGRGSVGPWFPGSRLPGSQASRKSEQVGAVFRGRSPRRRLKRIVGRSRRGASKTASAPL